MCLGGKIINKIKDVMALEVRLLLGRVWVNDLKQSWVAFQDLDNVLFLDLGEVYLTVLFMINHGIVYFFHTVLKCTSSNN